MEEIDYNDDSKEGKLRRWVDNLQLESWQLELLITGFSIFLLASGLDQYDAIQARINFDKFVITSDNTIILTTVGRALLASGPLMIKFFLISLLLHLLLRGFWIGIVGLSSVSNSIEFEKLNFKGPFRKHIPSKVRSLDDLIFYIDQVSSVIFAYTYLIVFSIISVVLVGCFLFVFIGLTNVILSTFGAGGVAAVLVTLIGIISLLLAVSAILFFLDSLLFSALKKSKWFSYIFYPIYRFFSIISLSFIYRSIYYHLITNFKRKQIALVTIVLLLVAFITTRIDSWDRYTFFPIDEVHNQYIIETNHYADEQGDEFILTASIPSKIVKDSFLPLFIRYSPQQNKALEFFCPDAEGINEGINFKTSIQVGMQSQTDTLKTVNELLRDRMVADEKMASIIGCIQTMYEVKIDGEPVNMDFSFAYHPNKEEKGFLQMLDLEGFERGRHVIVVNHMDYQGNALTGEVTKERFKMSRLAEIVFWKE